MSEFAQTVGDLAVSDLRKCLLQSLGAPAELERKAQEAESAQARADQGALLNTADEYARLVNSVRVSHHVLVSDICADTDLKTPNKMIFGLHARQNVDAELRHIKQTDEWNHAQGKIATDRLGHSYSQIGEVHLFLSAWYGKKSLIVVV